jgi:hypothetical protein
VAHVVLGDEVLPTRLLRGAAAMLQAFLRGAAAMLQALMASQCANLDEPLATFKSNGESCEIMSTSAALAEQFCNEVFKRSKIDRSLMISIVEPDLPLEEGEMFAFKAKRDEPFEARRRK